jgi:prepilin-type N-terminal cleavage/methylation domain-containing protein
MTASCSGDVWSVPLRRAHGTLLGFRGFTLVELAVVVAVIALLLGSILVPLTTQVAQRNISQTQRELEGIREALIGFAMVNRSLPCPAVSDNNGTARAACATAMDATGYLPWITLGVSRTDAWGKMYRYSVAPEFANSAVPFDFSTTLANTKTLQTRNGAGTPTPLATGVIAVVLSYGTSNWGRTADLSDIIDGSGTNVDEDENNNKFACTVATDCTNFWSRPLTANSSAAGGEFDDMLTWVSSSVLFSRMVAAGKLP